MKALKGTERHVFAGESYKAGDLKLVPYSPYILLVVDGAKQPTGVVKFDLSTTDKDGKTVRCIISP